jgi:hypothetical protein
MAFPDGRAPARYRRTHPNGPWIYTGGKQGVLSEQRQRPELYDSFYPRPLRQAAE